MKRLTCEQEVERDRRRRIRAEALHKLLNEALESLIGTGKYVIHARDTHRWIDSDGWYELAYYLCNDASREEILYVTTYISYEREFEEKWSTGEGHYGLEPCDIYWFDTGDPDCFRWCLEEMLQTVELKHALPEDLFEQIACGLTKDLRLDEEERTWRESLQG